MNFDSKLIQNVVDDVNRLKTQLADLETYKDDFTPEEIEETKKETWNQLIDATKRLDKMKSGSITTVTAIQEAQTKWIQVLLENYHTKDWLNSYWSNEVEFLREKVKMTQREKAMNKISTEEFNTTVIQWLELISKTAKWNGEEQKLYDSLKNKNMNQLQEDKGIDKAKIMENINQNK